MNKKTQFFLFTGLYLIIGYQLVPLVYLIISGNFLEPSFVAKTVCVISIYLFILSYFYLIPYRLNRWSQLTVLLLLLIFTIFSYTYPFVIAETMPN